MRYIDMDLIVGQPETQPVIDAAEAALQELLDAEDDAQRRAIIKLHRDKWVAFREHFERIYGSKCWYTESRNPGTDDDIDHFRPKGKIAEAVGHGGYWWEALSWRNFRLSSHRANRLRVNPDTGKAHGKGSHFPLIDEAQRWMAPDQACYESPKLLDPTDPEDPPLLTFDQDGRVALSPLYRDDDTASVRVEASRIYLHLDWPAFVKERRDLYARIYTRVLDGDRADRSATRHEAGAKETLKAVARDLIRLTRDHEPYSRAAQAYILHFRDRDWIKRCVLPYVPGGVER